MPGNVTKMNWNVPARQERYQHAGKVPNDRSFPPPLVGSSPRLVTFLAPPRNVPVTGMYSHPIWERYQPSGKLTDGGGNDLSFGTFPACWLRSRGARSSF